MPMKITIEVLLNAVMDEHFGYEKNNNLTQKWVIPMLVLAF
ncbi:hypothetical protein [Vibrio kanaloae]|nr:hypothetical protein [Vibrio kanaloae]